MNNFVEQVRKLNEKYGRVLTLEELEQCKKNGELKFEKKEPIDEYAHVHITDFLPENDTIECNNTKIKNGKVKKDDEFVGIRIRNKIHFSVNGRVLSHQDGNWDKRRYGIVFPEREFIKNNKDEIYSVRTEDSFVRGDVKMTDGILLCPKSDYDMLHKLNPNTLIIPVNEENVVNVADGNNIDCIKKLLVLMDIRTRKCKEYGWYEEGKYERDAEDEYREIVRNEMGRAPMIQDADSILKREEEIQKWKNSGSCMESLSMRTKRFFIKPGEKEHELSVQQLKESAKRIDDLLVENGMSILQLFEQISYFSHIYEERIIENEQIEEYLGIALKEMYDGDIIATNTKRIKMIKEKMKEEGEENNPVAKKAFENCVKHFIRDYKTLSQCYYKRIDMEGFDFEKYSKELDKSVLGLGINLEMMDEIYIFKQINDELEIQDFLKEQGYVENPASNLHNRSVNRLKFIYDILYKSAVEDYKSGNITENDEPNGKVVYKSVVTMSLIEEKLSKKIKEMENPEEILVKLKEMGYTIDENGEINGHIQYVQIKENAKEQAEAEKQQETKDKSNEMDNLKVSYGKKRVEPADLKKAQERVEATINQEQNQNQPIKEGEENDDH